MLTLWSTPLMITPNSRTMITVDVGYRINTRADYGVASLPRAARRTNQCPLLVNQ
jgi:hypothetical protein